MAKSQIQVTPRKNDVLARRIAAGVHRANTQKVPLKEPERWQLYIGNDYNNADDLYQLKHTLGWEPLTRDDLACKPEEVGYRVSEDGNLVRGPQGREMLFKMSKEDYALKQAAETAANNASIGRSSKTKAAAAEAVAGAFGPEAGDFVDKHLTGTITDTVETLP